MYHITVAQCNHQLGLVHNVLQICSRRRTSRRSRRRDGRNRRSIVQTGDGSCSLAAAEPGVYVDSNST